MNTSEVKMLFEKILDFLFGPKDLEDEIAVQKRGDKREESRT